MNTWMTALVGLCLGMMLALAIYRAVKEGSWRNFAAGCLALVAISLFLHVVFGFPTPSKTISKAASSDLAVATALFVCMVLGMAAQFIYNYLVVPKAQRKPFDLGLFVAPIFASPIVFIPLVAALQNADIDLTTLTIPRMMVFLVAFQNGFFWKDFFDRQQRELFGPERVKP
jgi:hypothetical protein